MPFPHRLAPWVRRQRKASDPLILTRHITALSHETDQTLQALAVWAQQLERYPWTTSVTRGLQDAAPQG